jgi:hypothetical protein
MALSSSFPERRASTGASRGYWKLTALFNCSRILQPHCGFLTTMRRLMVSGLLVERRFAAADFAVPESHPCINSSGVTKCSYDTSYGVILEIYSARPR